MTNEATTLADITSADWSLALDTPGDPGSGIGRVVQGAADVDQCIQIILSTPRGSDPLRPTFGADIWRYIDYPVNAATAAIVREVTLAITLWEPRVVLVKVAATPIIDGGAQSGARMQVSVTWRLKLASAPSAASRVQTTTVSFPTIYPVI
jgi:phage baseplate assembly protein W